MAIFNTKFSLYDTAYIVDEYGNISSIAVSDIYLRQNLSNSSIIAISYKGSDGTTIDESKLLYLDEAKLQALAIINEKMSSIQGLN